MWSITKSLFHTDFDGKLEFRKKQTIYYHFLEWSSVVQTCIQLTIWIGELYLNHKCFGVVDLSPFACIHGCEQAPIMTPFGSCRGPGATKWDYTAGYFGRLCEEAQSVKEEHIRGTLTDWLDSLRGSPSSKTLCVTESTIRNWCTELRSAFILITKMIQIQLLTFWFLGFLKLLKTDLEFLLSE